MPFLILIAFIAVPLIEIGLFIEVGGAIGLWPTIAVVILTAAAGTALLRHQGLSALARLQDSMEHGEVPLEPVFDGFCLLAAGALLLTPGFFTDAVGFALFVPPVRHGLRGFFAKRVAMQAHVHTHTHGHGQTYHHGPGHPGPGYPGSGQAGGARPPGGPGDVIDGEWQDVTDRPHDAAGPTRRLPDANDKPDTER